MSDPAASSPPPAAPAERSAPPPAPPPPAPRERHVLRWVVVGAVVLVVAVVTFFIGAAFLPRWWAHRIGDQVGQSTASGIGIGLFYGSVFTFLPLLVLWLGFRKRRSLKVWFAWLVAAAIVAIPNLLTLGIVLGRGDAAHAGERTLDVEGPYFRASSLIGAIAAVVIFAIMWWVLRMRRHGKRTERRLRAELKAREEADLRARQAAEAEAAAAAKAEPPAGG